MFSFKKRLAIEEKLAKTRKVTVDGQTAIYKNGLIFVEGDVGEFENPMTFDTYIHLYLARDYIRQLNQNVELEGERDA